MTLCTHLWLDLLLLLALLRGHDCFRNVTMTVEPPYVENEKHVLLGCHYDLQGVPLLSVKWYRGTFEFYRYSPADKPPQKIFPFRGINVELSRSNATAAYLRNVGFRVAGNVSCEVTMDTKGFKTRHASGFLQVVSPPSDPPEIRVNQEKYKAGDTLAANCTSSPSRPAARLSFYITRNNNQFSVPGGFDKSKVDDYLWVSVANITKLLYPGDFVDGQIVLRCVSQMEGYQDLYTELRLGPKLTKNGDPVPERVRSPTLNKSSTMLASTWLLLFLLVSLNAT